MGYDKLAPRLNVHVEVKVTSLFPVKRVRQTERKKGEKERKERERPRKRERERQIEIEKTDLERHHL